MHQTSWMLFCNSAITLGMLACHSGITAGPARGAPGPTEADWIRWTGVVVGVVGAIVVAPTGALVLLSEVLDAIRRAWRVARRAAARWLPWLRRDANVQLVPAPLQFSAPEGAVFAEHGNVSGGSLQDQINQLRAEVRGVRDEVQEARQEAGQPRSAQRQG